MVKKILYYLLGALVIVFLTGCAAVHIHDQEKTKVEYYLGVVNVNIDPSIKSLAVSAEGVGVLLGHSSATVGWLNEDVVVLENDCHSVFIIKNKNQAKEIKEILNYTELLPNIGCLKYKKD